VVHSKVPYIKREGIPISQIEFGVTEEQKNRSQDTIPVTPINKTEEVKWFEEQVIQAKLK
jgi:hypothetical protein